MFEEIEKQHESMNKIEVISRVVIDITMSITNMEELMNTTGDRSSSYHDTKNQ